MSGPPTEAHGSRREGGLATDEQVQEAFDDIAQRLLQQQDRNDWKVRHDEEHDDVAEAKEKHLHVLDVFRKARAEVGQRLKIGASQQVLSRRSSDPAFLQGSRVVGHQAAIRPPSLQSGSEQLRNKRQEWGKGDDGGNEHEGIEQRLEVIDPATVQKYLRFPTGAERAAHGQEQHGAVANRRLFQKTDAAAAVGMHRQEAERHAGKAAEHTYPQSPVKQRTPQYELKDWQGDQRVPDVRRADAGIDDTVHDSRRGENAHQRRHTAGNGDEEEDRLEQRRVSPALGPSHDRSRTIFQRGRNEVLFEQPGHRAPAAPVENAFGDEEQRQRDEEPHMDRQILQDGFGFIGDPPCPQRQHQQRYPGDADRHRYEVA